MLEAVQDHRRRSQPPARALITEGSISTSNPNPWIPRFNLATWLATSTLVNATHQPDQSTGSLAINTGLPNLMTTSGEEAQFPPMAVPRYNPVGSINWAILRGLPSMAVPRHKFSWQHPLNSPPWSVHRKLGHQHRPAQPHDDARRGGTILLAATTGAHSLLAVSTATSKTSSSAHLTVQERQEKGTIHPLWQCQSTTYWQHQPWLYN